MKLSHSFRLMAAAAGLAFVLLLTTGCTEKIVVLDPKGPIAAQQKELIIVSTLLTSIVIVPVLIMTAVIVWRYRDRKGRTAAYTPHWEHSSKLEAIWWGIPIVVILTLGIITVKGTYALEPSKPIESGHKTLTVQVTSLDWKWLFQYPEQNIATVNELTIPAGVPVRFEITADSPMNSFWVPQLGGQIYAMSGMAMVLHLQADEPGEYWGSGANFTGKDFAKMYFDVNATTPEKFDEWVADIKTAAPPLTIEGYNELAKPSASEVRSFSAIPERLFEKTVNKYAASHQHGASGAE